MGNAATQCRVGNLVQAIEQDHRLALGQPVVKEVNGHGDALVGQHLHQVAQQHGEARRLPIFMPLRQKGRYLSSHHAQDDGTQGHAVLLRYLVQMLADERNSVPVHFFDDWLAQGQAVILLDGLDEVADPALRRRVAQWVEASRCADEPMSR